MKIVANNPSASVRRSLRNMILACLTVIFIKLTNNSWTIAPLIKMTVPDATDDHLNALAGVIIALLLATHIVNLIEDILSSSVADTRQVDKNSQEASRRDRERLQQVDYSRKAEQAIHSRPAEVREKELATNWKRTQRSLEESLTHEDDKRRQLEEALGLQKYAWTNTVGLFWYVLLPTAFAVAALLAITLI